MLLPKKQIHRSMELTENPVINLHIYEQLIYDKRRKNIQWGKEILFNKWFWENWTATYKKMKLDNYLKPYTKINSKLIKDFNVRPETIKFLEENIGNTLFDTYLSNIFLDMSLQARETKAKIKKMGLYQTKNLLHSKGNH